MKLVELWLLKYVTFYIRIHHHSKPNFYAYFGIVRMFHLHVFLGAILVYKKDPFFKHYTLEWFA